VGDPAEEVSDEEHRVAAVIEEETLSLPDEEKTLLMNTRSTTPSFLQI